jgi:hypothetical protein
MARLGALVTTVSWRNPPTSRAPAPLSSELLIYGSLLARGSDTIVYRLGRGSDHRRGETRAGRPAIGLVSLAALSKIRAMPENVDSDSA